MSESFVDYTSAEGNLHRNHSIISFLLAISLPRAKQVRFGAISSQMPCCLCLFPQSPKMWNGLNILCELVRCINWLISPTIRFFLKIFLMLMLTITTPLLVWWRWWFLTAFGTFDWSRRWSLSFLPLPWLVLILIAVISIAEMVVILVPVAVTSINILVVEDLLNHSFGGHGELIRWWCLRWSTPSTIG